LIEKQPLVSVLMSAYNVEDYISDAITSVLSQTYKNIEYLIVDDGSTDRTWEIIKSFNDDRITAISQDNIGKSKTVNNLFDKAKGDYFLIQDADDISSIDRVQKLINHLQNNTDIAILFSGYALILNTHIVAPRGQYLNQKECRDLIHIKKMPSHDPTMLIRRDIALTFRFDENLEIGEGLDFILRVGEKYPIEVIPDILYYYRIHPESITKRKKDIKVAQLYDVHKKTAVRRKEQVDSFQSFYQKNINLVGDELNNLSGHFTDSAYQSVISNNRLEALRTSVFSLSYLLHGILFLKPLIYSVSPKLIAEYFRKH